MYKQTLRLALAFSLFSGTSLYAQSALNSGNVQYAVASNTTSTFQLFHPTQALDVSAARFAQNAQFLRLNKKVLARLVQEKLPTVSLVLPYNGAELNLDLVRVDIMTETYAVEPHGASVSTLPYTAGLHYQGFLRGTGNTLVAISFFENEILGLISGAGYNNLVLGKIQTAENIEAYMLYSDSDLAMDNPFECILVEPGRDHSDYPAQSGAQSTSGKALRIALEADYSLVQNRGGATAAVNYLTALFNQASAVYAREQIELHLSRVTVHLAPRFDHTAGATTVLYQYNSQLNQNTADLFQLVGMADSYPESASYLDGLCSPGFSGAYCAIEPAFSHVPTFSWAATVLIHQLGHQLGAQHAQWCGWPGGAIESCSSGLEGACQQQSVYTNQPTLMRYCLLEGTPAPLSAGFGRLPGNLIREHVAAAPCVQQAEQPEAVDYRSEEPSTVDIQVVPNPARDRVRIEWPAIAPNRQVTRLVLLDMLGRPVLMQALQGAANTTTLELAGLESGVYVLQIYEDDALLDAKRLIKE